MNYIRLRKNNLCVDNVLAIKLAKKYKTPFYCYSLLQLKNNFYTLNKAFKHIKPIICFSGRTEIILYDLVYSFLQLQQLQEITHVLRDNE